MGMGGSGEVGGKGKGEDGGEGGGEGRPWGGGGEEEERQDLVCGRGGWGEEEGGRGDLRAK